MNMNDYKKAASRLKASPGLKEEIIKKCKSKTKHSISKNKLVPVLAAAVIGCITAAAVFADEFTGIFKKDTNFEMNISKAENYPVFTGSNADSPDGTAQENYETMPVYKAELKKWDENIINDIFGKDKKIINEKNGDGISSPETFKSITYDDNSSVGIDNGYINYSRNEENEYDISNPFNQYNIDYGDNIKLTDSNNSSPAEKKAIETADSIADRLDINVTTEKTVYCCNEKYEAYAVLYNICCGYIPFGKQGIFHLHAYDTAGWHTDGVQVYAVIDRYGIAVFHANPIYEITENKGTVGICAPEKAAGVLTEYFDKNIPGYKTAVSECRLIYHAAEVKKYEEYELRPYWEFPSVSQTPLYYNKADIKAYNSFYIDAETLEMLTQNGNY